MASKKVEIVINRHGREIHRRLVKLEGTTTIGTLKNHFAKHYPALEFFDEEGDNVIDDQIVRAGETWTATATDRFPSLRELAEKAMGRYEAIMEKGTKRKRDVARACERWMTFVAPPSGLPYDERFHRASKPYEYWVLWREDFEKLEAAVGELLMQEDPKHLKYLLAGPAGTGKSHAVLALVNRLMRRVHNGAVPAKERVRLIPLLDCEELCQNFRRTLVQAMATAFGDAPLLVDELLQLDSDDEYMGFIERHSKWALFVLDQYQHVERNPEIQVQLNKILSGQRSLLVTSAGADDVKKLNTSAHQVVGRLYLAPALSEADLPAWTLAYGTEAVLTEERHRIRLRILNNNPLLMRAWHETCREAGVPVSDFQKLAEELGVELDRVTPAVLEAKGKEHATVGGLQQAERTVGEQPRTSAAEEGGQSPQKRQRPGDGAAATNMETDTEGELAAETGTERPPEGQDSEEESKAQADTEGRQQQSAAAASDDQRPPGGQSAEEERRAQAYARKGKRKENPSPTEAPPEWPPFETVYERFLQHRTVKQITTDLQLGYQAACKEGEGNNWISAHRRLLLSSRWVTVDQHLINGRNYFLAEDEQRARAANDLVRIVSAQFLENLEKSGAAFEGREILTALADELQNGRNPSMAGAYCERAVLAKFCRGDGKKLLPFVMTRSLPKVVSFETGEENIVARELIAEGIEAVRRGALDWTVVLKPISFQYHYIDVVQIVVRPAGKGADSAGDVNRRPNTRAYNSELQKTLKAWVLDRKLSVPPAFNYKKDACIKLLLADDKAKAAQQPLGALASSPSSSAVGAGGKQQPADGDSGADQDAGSLHLQTSSPDFEVHVYLAQVSLTKFAKHVFSTEGAMHPDFCRRLWHPDNVPQEAMHFAVCYILPESRLPPEDQRDCMLETQELPLRGRKVLKMIKHRQVCRSFEQFHADLKMVDRWPEEWAKMFQ